LARKAGISITESSYMADFEREAYVNMLIKELKEEYESIKSARAGLTSHA
jgi:hypothetical protein